MMKDTSLPLLKFRPILKDKIWGGTKLRDFYNKPSQGDGVGESWEISAVPGNVSEVVEGEFQGHTLRELVARYQEMLVGENNYKRFGTEFPLLIKIIDAKTDLSIQLHPDDAVAKAKHNSRGKTEMWYVMQADQDANLVLGFNTAMDKSLYYAHVAQKTINEVVHQEAVKTGDTFLVHPGLIHAIGAGVVIAEIQQTSDLTYRIYDYDRKDAHGNVRELHQEEAADVIDFGNEVLPKVAYSLKKNQSVNMVSCEHFITNIIDIQQGLDLHHDMDSFVIYIAVAGSAVFKSKVNQMTLKVGETLLVPASMDFITIEAVTAKVLQVYI